MADRAGGLCANQRRHSGLLWVPTATLYRFGYYRRNEPGRWANAVEDAAHAIKKEQGGDAIIVMNHADRADGSVTYANAFGNLNSNTGFVSGSGFAVNIPRRVDKATVMVIKWK